MTAPLRRHVVILGASGSIGRQGIEVCAAVPGLEIVALAAARSVAPVVAEAQRLGVAAVAFHDEAAAVAARTALGGAAQVFAGDAGLAELIADAADRASSAGAELVVLNGIVGAAGLRASLATLESGATLALANKESMVAGGPFVLAAARAHGARIIPVDSEHSAIFQCLEAGRAGAGRLGVERGENPLLEATRQDAGGEDAGEQNAAGAAARPLAEEILLTGSGGPFRGLGAAELAAVTPDRALKHPNWDMGPRVTIDSATLMNKGLELIEAHYLFGVPYSQIRVVVHPQSIVHSLVRYGDGALLAHLGVPDMRTPIGYALSWPERAPLAMVGALDLAGKELSFERPDTETFGCLRLAREAGEAAARAWGRGASGGPGAAAPIVLNAADEVAVAAFLERRLGFLDIERRVAKTLDDLGDLPVAGLDDVFALDAEARRRAAV